jgi:hypothetical protein
MPQVARLAKEDLKTVRRPATTPRMSRASAPITLPRRRGRQWGNRRNALHWSTWPRFGTDKVARRLLLRWRARKRWRVRSDKASHTTPAAPAHAAARLSVSFGYQQATGQHGRNHSDRHLVSHRTFPSCRVACGRNVVPEHWFASTILLPTRRSCATPRADHANAATACAWAAARHWLRSPRRICCGRLGGASRPLRISAARVIQKGAPATSKPICGALGAAVRSIGRFTDAPVQPEGIRLGCGYGKRPPQNGLRRSAL